MEKLMNKTNQVKTLLKTSKHLRDNDFMLIAKLWAMESGLSESNPLLKKLSDGKLTSPDYITRQRRKIQENNPSLRGKSYKARQIKGSIIKSKISK